MKFSKTPNPIQASIALLKKFIEICLEKQFLTEAQVNHVLDEIKVQGGLK